MSAKRAFNRGKKFDGESRLLIKANPESKSNYKDWQDEMDRTTNKGWAPSAKETGYPVLFGGPIAFDNDPSQNLSFPPEFCVFCNARNVAKGKQCMGLFIFNNNYPELGVRIGTRATHCMCHDCAEQCVFPSRPEGLHLPDRAWKDARADWSRRAEENMVQYVREQRMAGVEGNVFGSETRRERANG